MAVPRDPGSVDAEIESLWVNIRQQAARIRELEKMLDVWASPWWKRLLFWLDGWPANRLADRPAWRPWRRWFTS